MAKDVYYFPHDSNAKDDERCLYIINKYGPAGYGLYWCFIEKMHQQADGKLTCDLLDGLAINFNTDITLLKECYNTFITTKLFVTDGVMYWSERVLRNKQEWEKKKILKSAAGKLGMAKRWHTDNTVITEHNKGKERKGNNNKEINKEKGTYGELNNVLLTQEEYLKLKEKFNSHLEEKINNLSTYIASRGDKYKSHYATILSWANKETKNVSNETEDDDPNW